MSGTYVTDTGLVVPDFETNKSYWESALQNIFGIDIDLDPEGPFGQLVGLFALRDTNIFEAIQEVYTSRDPDSATGISLDILYGEKGLYRIPEGKTFVPNVLLYGTEGTTVLAGKQVKQSEGLYSSIIYSLTGNVTITESACRAIELTIGTPSTDEVFTITLDGVPYSHTTLVGQDAGDVAGALASLITAGAFEGEAAAVDDLLRVDFESEDFVVNSYTANFTLERLASAGSFQADEAGPYTVPIGTLDTIVTGQAGWDGVENPTSGETGRIAETDDEFRIRAANTQLSGNATEDAILQAVSNTVDDVTKAGIQSNRTDSTDGDGLPPHSFEVVVSGGLDQDIADVIWTKQPAGIASYGTTSQSVTDSQGFIQTIYFSRPTPIYIHVKVKRDLYSEEDYPADGDQQIKDAIVAWALTNQTIGKDVIRQRLSIPVYTVPGIENIEITIDGTASPGDTPTYAAANIDITLRETAEFSTDRIVVEDLTP